MKFNWGSGIALFYSVFALTMIGLAVKSTGSPVLLEKKNYYDDDINYQAILNKKHNAQALSQDVDIRYYSERSLVAAQFPKDLPSPTGTITFFRPSSLTKDTVLEIKTDTTRLMAFSVEGFKTGLWRVQVDWQADGKAFWREEKVFIDNFDPARPIH
jgi:nitrogen fixation protein FixH